MCKLNNLCTCKQSGVGNLTGARNTTASKNAAKKCTGFCTVYKMHPFLYQNTEQNVPLSEKADGASICWDEKPNYPLKLSDCQLQKGQEHNINQFHFSSCFDNIFSASSFPSWMSSFNKVPIGYSLQTFDNLI